MRLAEIVEYIGDYGPIGLIFLALWVLYHSGRQIYIYYFVVGILFNTILNLVLKGAIQEPRPADMGHPGAFHKRVENILHTRHGLPFNLFGMPSGHAQAILYIWTFMYLVLWGGGGGREGSHKPPVGWLMIWTFAIVGLITLYQRVEWGYHTWFQVVVGAGVGVAMGYGAYWFGRQKTKGVMQLRPDDGAVWSRRIGAGFL